MNAILLALALLAAPFALAASPAGDARMTCSTSRCHSEIGKGPVVHGPLKSQGCTVCHEVVDPSTPKHPKLRTLSKAETNNRCFVCHENYPGKLKALKVVHGAIEKDGCTGCHNPHQSEHKNLLKKDPQAQLCLDCHKTVTGPNANPTHHKIASMKNGCLNCHSSHGSSHAKILKAENPSTLCLNCHRDPQTATDGRFIEGVKDWLERAPVKHEPVAKGQCIKCHQIHGSDQKKLLLSPFTDHTYARYDQKEVGLCFECHKPELVSLQKASGETQFRNGDLNLHFVHVTGQKKQRTCRACHEVHASHQDRLIRTSFNYKNYELPIQFQKSESGGSCTTACHKEMKYDRIKAVENEKNKYQ